MGLARLPRPGRGQRRGRGLPGKTPGRHHLLAAPDRRESRDPRRRRTRPTENVVVGTNDTFDTQFEDGVISPASVQGQLLERTFEGDRSELDRQIEESLTAASASVDTLKVFGKQRRHTIGTVAVVRRGRTRYFLPAFTKMSATLPAHMRASIEDLEIARARTWQAINAAGQREPVHVPIIGSHLAPLGVSRTLLTQMIVLSFIAATRAGGPSSLTVWISPPDRDVVDLVMLDEWLRGLCAA